MGSTISLKPRYGKEIYQDEFNTAPEIEFTNRKAQIIVRLADQPLLVDQLVAWFGSQRVTREVNDLHRAGYIVYIPAALFYRCGRWCALSTKGMQLASHLRRKPIDSTTDYTKLNRERSPVMAPHDILSLAFRFAADLAARERDIEVVYGDALLHFMPNPDPDDPFKLTAKIKDEVATHADDYVGLIDHRLPFEEGSLLLMVEACNNSETIKSGKEFDARKVEDKLDFHRAYATQKRHQQQFGFAETKLLFPTTGPLQRLDTIRKLHQRKCKDKRGSPHVLFTRDDILFDYSRDILYDPVWVNGMGRDVSILPL